HHRLRRAATARRLAWPARHARRVLRCHAPVDRDRVWLHLLSEAGARALHGHPVRARNRRGGFCPFYPLGARARIDCCSRERARGLAFGASVGRFVGAGITFLVGAGVAHYHTIGTPVAMTAVAFAIGILLLPFGEETRGRPLPA